ncbi:ferric enterobactin receptor [Polaribacter irgensii 23-P]|uniref:Ferric enterobactin receptor n=1 Tax=Polaribacter irgensii 23-P TaxID=313594 RepID=A4BWR9_9FLAO|nr:TonB-dependent receptor [Polaribacter irgensii]EAR13410.1 ferric enterobactin receptor [Polaribacter irgensii 23-P]
MILRSIFIKGIFFVLVSCVFQVTTAQEGKKSAVSLSGLLDKIGNKYQIFFTYKANLISNKYLQEEGFTNLSLSASISLLEKLTPFFFDDLGNNYYVIYLKKTANKNRSVNREKIISSNIIGLNTFFKGERITVRGIVLSSDSTPLVGAALQEEQSLSGTTTDLDGTFEFEIQKGNMVTVSFLGHRSKAQKLNSEIFHTLVLVSGQDLDEVQVVGSRNKNRMATDTPVAIDFIDIEKASSKSSQVEINQFLQYTIPSFNASKQSGADGADHIDPATIRGLGPDQTLVLVNGKRRHQTSLINLYGTRGRGNSGTDLNAIPISAIKRIELLRDGASAQYGSDAIAGVLNIVLKDTDNELNVTSTLGFNNADSEGIFPNSVDGFTYKFGLNYGTKINEGGFINFSSEVLSTENTIRPGTSAREKYGQAAVRNASIFLNAEIPLHRSAKLYVNGGFNFKNTAAFAFTRNPNSKRNVKAIYPNGFNPLITSNIIDNSLSIGIRTYLKGWSTDLNNVVGRNNFQYFIKNTLNATLKEYSPTEFDAGGHQLIQNTTSIDFSKYFSKKIIGFNIAVGSEYRLDKYRIFSGEEASYGSYDVQGDFVNSETPPSDYTSFNGQIVPGGSQGFPGYSPENEVNRNRSNISFYLDTEIDFSKRFMLGTAVRFEYYSDFGSTLNYKLASRYRLSNKLNMRSSFSTGFRAPSLVQSYYNLKFTNFIGDAPSESLLVANNSPIARRFGIENLKEEKARNFSFGLATKLGAAFNATIDAYYVAVKDRIILSGNFDASDLNIDVDNVQFFANGVDTKTTGVDLVLNWGKKWDHSELTLNLSGNVNEMSITKIKNKNLDKETFFGARDRQFLIASAPKNKFNLGIHYQYKKLKTSLNFTRFSSVQLIDWKITQSLSKFNNSEIERLAAATDIYRAKLTTDLHFSYQLNRLINLQIGTNNLFNIYPTKQDSFTDSGGLWDATQMGTNGAFYYTKLNIKL